MDHPYVPKWSRTDMVLPHAGYVHTTKAVERNKMPFGSYTRVVPSNTVLDMGPGSPREGGGNPIFDLEISVLKTL